MNETFKTVPQHFEQLYTAHTVQNNFTIPIVYTLFPDRRADTYRKLFAQIKSSVPNLKVTILTSDFDLATIIAINLTHLRIMDVFFHLGQ